MAAEPVVGIAKQLIATRSISATVFEADLSFVVENLGPIAATNVQVSDDLNATFPGVASIEIVGTPNVGGFTAAAMPYDGTSQVNLLAGSDTLAIDAIETITFTVRIDLGTATGPFENQATVTTADTPGGPPTSTDLSDNGTDPDPSGDDDPNSDPDACQQDPADPACEDTPTPIDVPMAAEPVVGIAKQLIATRSISATVFEADLSFVVENLGPIAATNVQVSDDLNATFPGVASIEIVGTPNVGGFTAAAVPYDGTSQVNLLAGSDTLAIDAVETITFTVRVDLGTATGPFENQATVTTSDTPGGPPTSTDLSDDGTDPDPSGDDDPNSDPDACNQDPNDPACEDTPTPIDVPMAAEPVVGIAKQLIATRSISATVFEADLSFVVENLGPIAATNVQVSDDLNATFPGVASIEVIGTPNVGGFTAAAVPYDGTSQVNLLAGSDTLAVDAVETITFTVRVDLGTANGPFENQATVTTADTPGGPPTSTDLSDDGADPDPSGDDDPNSDPDACTQDPNEPACEDTPTPIDVPMAAEPVVGIAKQLIATRSISATVFEADLSFVVENLGPIAATNVQVSDDLNATFPGVASIEVIGTPNVGGFTAATVPYDGTSQVNLLAGSDTLAVDAVETITFTVRVDLGTATGPFENQATVTTADTPGGPPTSTDLSDDGTDPDPSGDDDPNSDPDACTQDPNDPACEDTPTPIDVPMAAEPVVGIAKQLIATRSISATVFEADLSFVVENLGPIAATNVQVSDDLNATFPGVASIEIVGTPNVGGFTAAAVPYDGTSQIDLLAGGDTLAIDAVETITFTVRVDLGTATGPFENQATVTTADTPGGPPTSTDLSDDGTDPDPSGDDDPNSDPDACNQDPNDPACEDTPTPIDVPMAAEPVVGIAKQLIATRSISATVFEADLSFVVENLGPIAATNVQVSDDLNATFPGVASIEVIGTPNVGGFTAATVPYDGTSQVNLLGGRRHAGDRRGRDDHLHGAYRSRHGDRPVRKPGDGDDGRHAGRPADEHRSVGRRGRPRPEW